MHPVSTSSSPSDAARGLAASAPRPTTRRLARLRRAAARVLERSPLTPLGALVLGLAALAYWGFGIPRVDYVLQLVALLALALVGLALLVVGPGALLAHRAHRRWVEARPSDEVVLEAERGFAILLRMPSFRAFPLIDLSWQWVAPDDFRVTLLSEPGELVEQVEASGRADVQAVTRRLVIEDAFGLARVLLYRTTPQRIRVLPFPGKLGSAPLLRAHAGGEELSHPLGVPDGDRVEMRHYVPGDPLRLALWKVYARTGELMVRMPERAISPSWRIVAYLVATEGDEPAAAAARVALESGLFGDGWRFSADGALRAASAAPEALQILAASRSARGTAAGDGAGLAGFLEEVGEGPRTRLILFLPAREGPWLARALEATRGFAGAVTAVVATDRVLDEVGRSPVLDRWIRRPAPANGAEATTTTDQLGRVADQLAAAGAYVVAVERPGGRVLVERRQGARRVA